MSHTPWRFRCPNGHTSYSIRQTRGVIKCHSCGQEYRYKIDAKDGSKIKV